MTTDAYRTTPVELPSLVSNIAGTPTPEVAPTVSFGTGSPEAVVTAPVGSIYLNTGGPTLYVKASGADDMGWSVAIAVAPIALTSLANQATHTLLGNTTGGSAPPTALTYAAVKTALAIAYTDVSGISTVGHTGAYSDLTGSPTLLNYVGTGTPEGTVTAAVGSNYIDIAVTAVPVRYCKTTGSGNTGWVQA